MAPGLPEIAQHYHITSETIVAMTLSIFLLTFAIGPLFLAPLSEIYGRTWVSDPGLTSCTVNSFLVQILHIGNLLFLAFNLACAFAPNTGTLIGMRLLCEWHWSVDHVTITHKQFRRLLR